MVRFFALLIMSMAVGLIFLSFTRPLPPGESEVKTGKVVVSYMVISACLILGGYYGFRSQTKK